MVSYYRYTIFPVDKTGRQIYNELESKFGGFYCFGKSGEKVTLRRRSETFEAELELYLRLKYQTLVKEKVEE